jgi:hypothetical protein
MFTARLNRVFILTAMTAMAISWRGHGGTAYAQVSSNKPPPTLSAPDNAGIATQGQVGGMNFVNPSFPPNTITGWQITGNGQGGAAAVINSGNAFGIPSNGAIVNVHPQPGQSAAGVDIQQNGPGTGLIINHSGPGTGLTINVGQ